MKFENNGYFLITPRMYLKVVLYVVEDKPETGLEFKT